MLQQYWKSTWFCSVANVRCALSSSSCCRSSAIQSSVSRVQSSTTLLCFRMLPTSVIRCRRCRISSLSTERIVDMSCSSTWTRWSANWSKRSMLAVRRCIFCWCLPRWHSFRWDRIRMRGMNTLQLFGHSSSTWPQCMRCSYKISNTIQFIESITQNCEHTVKVWASNHSLQKRHDDFSYFTMVVDLGCWINRSSAALLSDIIPPRALSTKQTEFAVTWTVSEHTEFSKKKK